MLNQLINIAEITAPGKAILCGQHAVVYGEDAIAFAINLKSQSKVYKYLIKSSEQKQQFNHIHIQIKINETIHEIKFKRQFFLIAQKIIKINEIVHINNFKLNNVQINFETFCTQLKKYNLLNNNNNNNKNEKIEQNMIILTTIYKMAVFLNIFNCKFNMNKEQATTLSFYNEEQTINNDNKSRYNYLIQTSSSIPIGKGLGSSAAFNTVLASSLFLILCQNNQSLQFCKINQSSYKQLINYISKIFQQVQHGKPSGIDNFVSVYGGLVLFNKVKSQSFKLIDDQIILNKLQKQICFGVVDSQIQKNTKKAVEQVRQKYQLYKNGQIKYKNMIEQIGTFSTKILKLLQSQQNQSIIINELFKILTLNHFYLKQLGLSNDKIQQIVKKYTVQNNSTAKITGSGMGGVVLVIGKKQFMNKIKSQQHQGCQNKDQIIICEINTKGLQIKLS